MFCCDRYYDRAELTADPHFVAKVLMQCPTATKRLQLMRGLEQKYGPEASLMVLLLLPIKWQPRGERL